MPRDKELKTLKKFGFSDDVIHAYDILRDIKGYAQTPRGCSKTALLNLKIQVDYCTEQFAKSMCECYQPNGKCPKYNTFCYVCDKCPDRKVYMCYGIEFLQNMEDDKEE